MKSYTKSLLAAMSVAVAITSTATAQTTATASGNWTDIFTWDVGVPDGTVDVIISSGVDVNAVNAVTPWSGSLTLQDSARLQVVSTVNPNAVPLALDGATSVILGDGALISDRFKTATLPQNFTITGTAGMDATGSNNGWNHNRIFEGVISGDTWTTKGFNHMGYTYNVAQDFDAYIIESGDRHGVSFNVAGAAGNGDVTLNGRDTDGRSAVIITEADNVFASTAVLSFNNARGWATSTGGFGPYASGPQVGTEIVLRLEEFTQNVAQLFFDGVEIAAGTYTGADFAWLHDEGGMLIVGDAGPMFILGDTNNDGTVDTLDIDPFVLLLTDPAGYATAFPGVDALAVGDINMDDVVDTLDIDPFVALLTAGSVTGGGAVPEPSTVALLSLAGLGLLGLRNRRK